MQKIRCPQCGAINLEKFISFPHCAGCGSTLPQVAPISPASFWRKPVKPVLWVSIIGLALGGLTWVASLLQVQSETESQVVVYGNTPRRLTVDQLLTINIRIDAVGESRRERLQPLRNVQLRLPLRVFKTMRFVAIDPPPDEMRIVGYSRYFLYDMMQRETAIKLTLRPTQAGVVLLPITVYATERLPNDWRIRVSIAPKPKRVSSVIRNDASDSLISTLLYSQTEAV